LLIIPTYLGLWLLQILCFLIPMVLCRSYFRKTFHNKKFKRISLIVLNGLSIIIFLTFLILISDSSQLAFRIISMIVVFILNYITLSLVIFLLNYFIEMNVMSKKVIQFEKNHTINHLLINNSQQMLPPLKSATCYLDLLAKEPLTKQQSFNLIQAKNELKQVEYGLDHYHPYLNEKWNEQREMSFVKELQDVVHLMKSYAQMHQVELLFTSTVKEDVSIMGDPEMLRFALLNIIKNGVEASSPKGCVNISLHEMIKDVFIVIEDNGNGIPKHVIRQIGKPLTSGKLNGSGLGLASTYKITESMGGRVEVASHLNKGTIFSLYFPKWVSIEG